MVVLVPIGSLLVEENRTEADWVELVAKAKKQVIEVMEGRLGLTGLKDMIVWEEVNTPVSCESTSMRWWLIASADICVWAVRERQIQSDSRFNFGNLARLFQCARFP